MKYIGLARENDHHQKFHDFWSINGAYPILDRLSISGPYPSHELCFCIYFGLSGSEPGHLGPVQNLYQTKKISY